MDKWYTTQELVEMVARDIQSERDSECESLSSLALRLAVIVLGLVAGAFLLALAVITLMG